MNKSSVSHEILCNNLPNANLYLIAKCSGWRVGGGYEFNFNGYVSGEKIKTIFISYAHTGDDFIVGDEYILKMKATDVKQGILTGFCAKAINLKVKK